MKKVLFLLAACMLFSMNGYSQFSFGVAPGLSTNSSYFGYRAGKFVPYVGFQYANISVNTKESGEKFDTDLQEVVSYTDKIKATGNLYVPNIGVKYFAVEQNKLKAYFNLSIAKPFLRAKFENNGEELDDVSDVAKDIKLIGGEFGFGVEYFFDDNFSLGGEFGVRYIGANYKSTRTDSFYNEVTSEYQDTEIKDTYTIGLNPTYSKISLNFYFNGKSK